MKKQSIPVALIGGLIALILLITGIVVLIINLTPSKERMNLSEYYQLTEESQVAISYNGEIVESFGTLIDGHVYLDFEFIYNSINARFYWDTNENILLYTTANDVISAKADANKYYIGKSSKDFGRPIVKATAKSALIDIDFVNIYSNISYTYYENPSRVVITGAQEDLTIATSKKNTQIRYEDNIKSPILSDVKKGNSLTVISTDKKWTKVSTEDGISGYIRSNALKDTKTIDTTKDYKEEEFLHIKKDEPINLLWHQINTTAHNAKISEVLSSTKGVNVISPTWFKVKDTSGDLISLASKEYVDYCHEHDVEVWALVYNFGTLTKEETSYLLNHTSKRQNLVNQLVAAALQYNLDGINVDFENMDSKTIGDGYIQFIRELSINCDNNDIVLSTDVAIPASFNQKYHYTEQSYFTDYIIMMAYAEHWGPESGDGSVASITWVEEAINNALAEDIPKDQLVLGMPFYCTLWTLTPTSTDKIDEETEYLISCKTFSMDEAQEWMDNNVGTPKWLEDCGQYFGEFIKDDVIYRLWQEDVTSLEGRLKLMQDYSLAGAAFWEYGKENSAAWDLIIKYIN